LALAEELGLDELRAAALTNLGASRMAGSGAAEGARILERAIAVADEAGAGFEAARARGNLAAHLWLHGELERASALWVEAAEVSRRLGQTFFTRWFQGILGTKEYVLGRWDEAFAIVDSFPAEIESGSPHYLAGENYTTRARIRLARDDVDG